MTITENDIAQTAESVTEIIHEPWCNNHYTGAGVDDDPSGCRWEQRMSSGAYVNVEEVDGGRVTVWSNDSALSPEAAVELASAIVEAASLARGETRTTAAVLSNLTRAIGRHGPMDVDIVAEIAVLLLGDVAEQFTRRENRSVSVRDAARLTSLPELDIREAINSGRLEAVKSGKRLAIRVGALETWLESLPKATD